MHSLHLFIAHGGGEHSLMHRQKLKCWIQRLQAQMRGAVRPSLTFHLLHLCRHMLLPHICSSHTFKIQARRGLHAFPLLSLYNVPQAIG